MTTNDTSARNAGRPRDAGDDQYQAEIRYTTHGVPHIRAGNWGDLGFGQGWACARDHLPTIADQIVKVRSERSKFHGVGRAESNLASDLGYLTLGVVERAGWLREQQPAWIRELVSGYVAGYNTRVREALAAGSLPDWCAGAEWVRPIDELDLYAYMGDVALMASGRNLAQLLGWAQAPGPDGPYPAAPVDALTGPAGASNGWAVGGDVMASGGGAVLANPHFPWGGEARFWECHLTLPGEMDVYGVSLLGLPGVQMGFNRGLGWAHTFSKGHRFTLYRLDLVPGDPTSYRYGAGDAAEVRRMESAEHRVTVRAEDGTQSMVRREMWRTHHGPMVNLPLLGWGQELAFSYRDANVDNASVLEQFLRMGRADDMDSFRAVFDTVKGLPWVNTLAADHTGRAWYTDASATPRLSDGARERFLARLDDDLVAALLFQNRIALLDGSDPDDEWVDSPGARSPGLEPPERLPSLERRDVLVNANDSHWLSSPSETLVGHPVLCGLERTPRSLRTRQNLRLAAALTERGDATVDDLLAAVFANQSLSAELLRRDVVGRCSGVRTVRLAADDAALGGDATAHADGVTAAGVDIEIAHAVTVLADWDGTVGLDAIGAALWREVMAGFTDSDWRSGGSLFDVAFDPEDPIATPHTLRAAPTEGPDPVLLAVARAVCVLRRAGVALDAPLGEVQWAMRGEVRVPVHGGGEAEGVMNVLTPSGALATSSLEPQPPAARIFADRSATGLAEGGYQVTYGTSFLMAVELTEQGPRGLGLMAYGQNGDPRSPHHLDGTVAYAASEPRALLFHDADIEADPALVRVVVDHDGRRSAP